MNEFMAASSSNSNWLNNLYSKGDIHLSVKSRSRQIIVLRKDQMLEAMPGIGIAIRPNDVRKERSFSIVQTRFIPQRLNSLNNERITRRT
ncbi:hypothetical protein FGO68_gene13123 [Halteria grandinella]|uniref:Uncharacterized protein n=1 Tax=Halteria grandinella TaxID=5974 RepID=A0A8J8SXK6_HALGN|nr:hypothetical protein FGO68_gene13123 [Halteria grandinella]